MALLNSRPRKDSRDKNSRHKRIDTGLDALTKETGKKAMRHFFPFPSKIRFIPFQKRLLQIVFTLDFVHFFPII